LKPADLLKTLEAEGVSLSLNLKVSAAAKPSDATRALVRDNRDTLLEYLTRERCPVPATQSGLTLYGDLLLNLMVWAGQYQELRLEHPNGVILNARPEHISPELHPWGVVYDCERRVLVSWGDVPTSALRGKHDLTTGEPMIRDSEALYLLRQRNVAA